MIIVGARLQLFLLLLPIFFAAAAIATLLVSTSLSTIAISKLGDQATVVCALVLPDPNSGEDLNYTLKCVSVADVNSTVNGTVKTYPSGDSFYYAGISAGDGFLCGLSDHYDGNVSVMRWWEFPDQAENRNETKVKRLYHGIPMVKLSSGDSHVCGIVGDDRRIDCWRWVSFDTQQVQSNLTDIAVGGNFVCVILSDGNIKCYSDCDEETSGVVGHEPTGTFVKVAAGDTHACGLKDTGDLYCWGDGAPKSTEYFNQKMMDRYTSMALGDNSTCVIRENETVACWGNEKDDEGYYSSSEKLRSMSFLSITAKGGVFCGVERTMYCMFCWRGRRSEPGFGSNYTVRPFDRVLPGPCVRNCDKPMEGAGRLCPPQTSICEVTLAPKPPPLQTPSSGDAAGSGPEVKSTSGNSERKKVAKIAVPIVAGTIFIAASLFTIFQYRQRKSRRSQVIHVAKPLPFDMPGVYGKIRQELDQTVDERLTELIGRGQSTILENYTLEMLLKITGNFSAENIIGTGGFGSVYRGLLDDGREVAVKRAEQPPSTSGSRITGYNRYKEKKNAFMAELGLLTHLNHRNLVRLIGFCREDEELVLVYEYMANGTLKDHIHNAPKSPISSWKTRITIALNAARGIDYLHNYAVPAIIHRDIKSSNILLDDKWTAKVSDFGLCLVDPVGNNGGRDNVDGYSYTSLRTAGTLGYMDPEYYRTHCLTTKSDVYSFGVVLLEILTGCKAIHFDGNREGSFDCDVPRNVVDFAPQHIESGALQNVLDRNLPPPRPSEIEGVQILADLAANCVQLESRKRPGIADVVRNLELALDSCNGDPPFFRSMTAHSA